MCSPTIYNGVGILEKKEMLKYPLLTQSAGSMLRPILHEVIDNPRLPFSKTISCNNMSALAELAAHGLGITILPKAFFSRYVNEGRLHIMKSEFELPKLEYFLTCKNDYHGAFFEEIAEICRNICDFTKGAQKEP
ncbi:LysR substrate-binding domain-containing protein [Sinorhizobium sp. RAC02]|uniref:LysR substrate-binding domain-containing protein n=1 Tax=Sinorhizobium sp. RAC02 TaxID=1842534 RepID=UPI000855656B|nr:LysR substrate-binding domain-containing protein [Sinorhizobium sp. RAC02]AOF94031.1 lysR substrate binding domain protein [Sinorhizobium sp. RAC02]